MWYLPRCGTLGLSDYFHTSFHRVRTILISPLWRVAESNRLKHPSLGGQSIPRRRYTPYKPVSVHRYTSFLRGSIYHSTTAYTV